MDPGTSLAVVQVGLQVCQGLLSYYQTVKDANEEIQRLYKKADGLRSTLQAVKQVLEGRQCSGDVLEQIDATCLQCEELITRLQVKLEKVSMQMKPSSATEMMKHGIARASYPFRRSTLCKLQEMIEELQPRLSLVLAAGFQDITQRTLDTGFVNISNDVRSLQKVLMQFHKDNEHDEINKWLAITDHALAQRTASKAKQSGTGSWLFETGEFLDWAYSDCSRLWLHGTPGCGKTVLCSSIVERLGDLCAIKADMQYAYYYFSFAEEAKQDLENCASSLIVQLCSNRPAPQSLRNVYAARRSGRPGIDQLKTVLQELIRDYDRTFILFDAIDECPEVNDQRKGVLEFIRSLLGSAGSKLHVLVLSRDERDIRRTLKSELSSKSLCIGAKQQSEDIICYVQNQINAHQRLGSALSPTLKEHVVSTIQERADGMFRWAHCQVERLKKLKLVRAKDVEHVLNSMPETLNGTYERILCEISDLEKDAAVSALRWLTFSRSPLNAQELAHAISINQEAETIPAQDDLVSIDGLSELMSSLIVKQEVSGQIYFKLAHFSVREYLVSEFIQISPAAAFALNKDASESILARQSLAYILQCSRHFLLAGGHYTPETYPLLFYATRKWHVHQNAVKIRSFDEADMCFLNILLDKKKLQEMTVLYRPDFVTYHPTPDAQVQSPLYYASVLGLEFCVNQLLDMGFDVNVKGGRHDTCLQAALRRAGRSHNAVVDRLLTAGADVNAQGGEYGSPLATAARIGSDVYVEILISKGADVTASQRHAMHPAMREGHVTVVKKLLDAGLDVNILNNNYGTPLIAAARYGETEIVQLLLDYGAIVDIEGSVEGRKFVNALQAAAWCHLGQPAVDTIRLLVKRGAQVNSRRGDYGTALVTACDAGNEDTAIALLELGADPNIRSNVGQSPLEAAMRIGLVGLSNVLQDYGAKLLGFDGEIEQHGGQRSFVAHQVRSGTRYGGQMDKADPAHDIMSRAMIVL